MCGQEAFELYRLGTSESSCFFFKKMTCVGQSSQVHRQEGRVASAAMVRHGPSVVWHVCLCVQDGVVLPVRAAFVLSSRSQPCSAILAAQRDCCTLSHVTVQCKGASCATFLIWCRSLYGLCGDFLQKYAWWHDPAGRVELPPVLSVPAACTLLLALGFDLLTLMIGRCQSPMMHCILGFSPGQLAALDGWQVTRCCFSKLLYATTLATARLLQ